MSTWISKAALVLLLTSGCVAPNGVAGLLAQNSAAPRQVVTVLGVKLAGPDGFCPLPATRQLVGAAGFVAFAPCDGDQGALLTATVGAPGSAEGITLNQARMAPYFQTAAGIDALRGPEDTGDITLREVRDHSEAVVLRLTRETPAGKSDAWRAFGQVDGKLITLSLRPRDGEKISASQGNRWINRFVDAIRGANDL
jgi:hypothetical protein